MYLKYFGQNACCIFCVLTTKYKIQAVTHYHYYRPVQRKVTMSHEVQSKLLYTKRFSAVDIVP